MTFRIAVMVKVVPKPEEVRLDEESMTLDRDDADSQLNPADKNAVELALQLADTARTNGDEVEVIAVSMGPPLFEDHLQDVVAMGVDDAVLLSDRAFGGADTYPTSRVLAAGIEAIGDVDLVLCGEESSDSSTGQVPPGIAAWLDAAQVTYVSEAELTDGSLVATRTVSGGHERVRVPLPAVVSVEYGVNDPRFPDFKRKRWAASEWDLTIWDHEDLGLSETEVGLAGSKTEVVSLEAVDAPDRLGEWVDGDAAEQAGKLSAVITDAVR
ncbi:MAG: electron transfer flavoprotein subunit beta/FixA family protein [Halobacteriales archaeon]|nr:electron transfer flavoprotein subunit beta/FixA family protein [Halobacteriales archaeon]